MTTRTRQRSTGAPSGARQWSPQDRAGRGRRSTKLHPRPVRISVPQGELVATTFLGLEDALAAELRELDAADVRPRRRAVAFRGDTRLLYRANIALRTALRVVQPVAEFEAADEEQLYQGIRQVEWQRFVSPDGTLAVESALATERFRHSHYVALKTKDAIVDRFRDACGRRPSVDVRSPDLRVHVYIHGSRCTVSLDSSGDSLHRRGYRQQPTVAPLNEATAAALVLYTGWRGAEPFVDPMCGSGTVPIEAALIAANRAPGSIRPAFGFMRWPDFDKALWEQVSAEVEAGQRVPPYPIVAADQDPAALAAARANARAAGVEGFMSFVQARFEDLPPPAGNGVLVMNPPYGERLALADASAFYESLGRTLAGRYGSWKRWILSGNRAGLDALGVAAADERTVYNGKIACAFRHYPSVAEQ